MLVFLFLFLFVSFPVKASHIWIVGNKSLVFYPVGQSPKTFPIENIETSVVDPVDCGIWVQTPQSFFKINTQFQKEFETPLSLTLLGDSLIQNSFVTFDEENWQIRDSKGLALNTFPAPAAFPRGLQGDSKSGFWTLDFKEKEKLLELVHFDKTGKIFWKKTISQGKELWGNPALKFDEKSQSLWIGYSVTSPEHVYSPRIESWSSLGMQVSSFQSKERGLLFDACIQSTGHLVTASDLPSSPYTAPLFSFLDRFDSHFFPKRLHTTDENWLIPSIQCSSSQIWMLKTSLFGGSEHQLADWSPSRGEKIHFIFKEPAWKIHYCSL